MRTDFVPDDSTLFVDNVEANHKSEAPRELASSVPNHSAINVTNITTNSAECTAVKVNMLSPTVSRQTLC